jgi:hypothetical protein
MVLVSCVNTVYRWIGLTMLLVTVNDNSNKCSIFHSARSSQIVVTADHQPWGRWGQRHLGYEAVQSGQSPQPRWSIKWHYSATHKTNNLHWPHYLVPADVHVILQRTPNGVTHVSPCLRHVCTTQNRRSQIKPWWNDRHVPTFGSTSQCWNCL